MKIEEEYADVLYNIEFAIVTVYESNPELVDRDVLTAIDSLSRAYERERKNPHKIMPKPSGKAGTIFEQCRRICEWQVGRQSLNESDHSSDDPQPRELSVKELMHCLKRLRKSIRLWHKQGGRQGYLTYVHRFITQTNTRL